MGDYLPNIVHFASHLAIPHEAYVDFDICEGEEVTDISDFHAAVGTILAQHRHQECKLSLSCISQITITIECLDSPDSFRREIHYFGTISVPNEKEPALWISEMLGPMYGKFTQITHLHITSEGDHVYDATDWWSAFVHLESVVDLKITSSASGSLSLRKFLHALIHTECTNGKQLLLPHMRNLSLDKFCSRSSSRNKWHLVPGLLKSALEMRICAGSGIRSLEMLFCGGGGIADIEVIQGLVPVVQYTEVACKHVRPARGSKFGDRDPDAAGDSSEYSYDTNVIFGNA